MDRQINKTSSKVFLTEKNKALLPAYPVDMSSGTIQRQFIVDHVDISFHTRARRYQPIVVAQDALVKWNQYLINKNQDHLDAFLKQAYWLVEHEVRIVDGAGGWPMYARPNKYVKGPWLSASMQGLGLSVLVRAYE